MATVRLIFLGAAFFFTAPFLAEACLAGAFFTAALRFVAGADLACPAGTIGLETTLAADLSGGARLPDLRRAAVFAGAFFADFFLPDAFLAAGTFVTAGFWTGNGKLPGAPRAGIELLTGARPSLENNSIFENGVPGIVGLPSDIELEVRGRNFMDPPARGFTPKSAKPSALDN